MDGIRIAGLPGLSLDGLAAYHRALGSTITHIRIVMNGNVAAAIGISAAYIAGVLILLQPRAFPHMLGVFAALVVAVFVSHRAVARRVPLFGSTMAVSLVATLLLAVPNFGAFGGQHEHALPLGFFGGQAVVLLWVALCWAPQRPRSQRATILSAIGGGLGAAAVLSGIATIPVLVGLISERSQGLILLWIYPAYCVAGLLAGLTYWLLQGISHHTVGRYLIGAVAGMCLYGAVAPIVIMMSGSELDIARMLVLAVVCGVLVGPPVALSVEKAA